MVAPEAWGGGAERPENCPVGRCCLVADDPDTAWEGEQPEPVDGLCALVFQSDRYDTNLGQMLTQAVLAIARGGRFAIAAELRDDRGDQVDVGALVERVEAIAEGECAGRAIDDRDGDGVPETFDALTAGSAACFRIVARANVVVPPAEAARRYRATLRLTGDGVAGFASRDVWFVVPPAGCGPVVE